jgi:hypothetical protein
MQLSWGFRWCCPLSKCWVCSPEAHDSVPSQGRLCRADAPHSQGLPSDLTICFLLLIMSVGALERLYRSSGMCFRGRFVGTVVTSGARLHGSGTVQSGLNLLIWIKGANAAQEGCHLF